MSKINLRITKDLEGPISLLKTHLRTESGADVFRYAVKLAAESLVRGSVRPTNTVSPAKVMPKLCPKHGMQLMGGRCSNGCDLN